MTLERVGGRPGRHAATCRADADDDLREQDLAELVKCIRLCLDCVDVCTATAGVISRQTDYHASVTAGGLRGSCKRCGDECERHAHHHEHCGVCEQACRELLDVPK